MGGLTAKSTQNPGYGRLRRPAWVVYPSSVAQKPGMGGLPTDLGGSTTDSRWQPPCFQDMLTSDLPIRISKKVVPFTFRISA
ncbi:hypothetical protein BHM03_00050461 [Ensete ventricosum]|nr:hypothetical protein BHM03_00050461 [Ensete ventricosum]